MLFNKHSFRGGGLLYIVPSSALLSLLYNVPSSALLSFFTVDSKQIAMTATKL